MSARLADLLAEQFHPTAAAAVRAGHCDLAAAIEAEIDGCGGPWPFGSGPSTQAHDRALIHVVRAWGRGDECAAPGAEIDGRHAARPREFTLQKIDRCGERTLCAQPRQHTFGERDRAYAAGNLGQCLRSQVIDLHAVQTQAEHRRIRCIHLGDAQHRRQIVRRQGLHAAVGMAAAEVVWAVDGAGWGGFRQGALLGLQAGFQVQGKGNFAWGGVVALAISIEAAGFAHYRCGHEPVGQFAAQPIGMGQAPGGGGGIGLGKGRLGGGDVAAVAIDHEDPFKAMAG
mgnify:CR=1 FL=1